MAKQTGPRKRSRFLYDDVIGTMMCSAYPVPRSAIPSANQDIRPTGVPNTYTQGTPLKSDFPLVPFVYL